jgi:hypothetical protein
LKSPVFLLVCFGYAPYIGTIAGFGTFGPDFLIGLQMCKSEATASLLFGGDHLFSCCLIFSINTNYDFLNFGELFVIFQV